MDASKRLSALCSRENGKITRCPQKLRILDNGVEHYFVEVTCNDGIQYGLQAYGEEAVSLFKENNENSWKDCLTWETYWILYFSSFSVFSVASFNEIELIQ